VVVVLACLAAWFFSPKGETQTYAILYHLILALHCQVLHIKCKLLTSAQDLAKLPHSLIRELLPYVGYVSRSIFTQWQPYPFFSDLESWLKGLYLQDHLSNYLPCTIASSHRTTTRRPERLCSTWELKNDRYQEGIASMTVIFGRWKAGRKTLMIGLNSMRVYWYGLGDTIQFFSHMDLFDPDCLKCVALQMLPGSSKERIWIKSPIYISFKHTHYSLLNDRR
jgi:hypothetical protein